MYSRPLMPSRRSGLSKPDGGVSVGRGVGVALGSGVLEAGMKAVALSLAALGALGVGLAQAESRMSSAEAKPSATLGVK